MNTQQRSHLHSFNKPFFLATMHHLKRLSPLQALTEFFKEAASCQTRHIALIIVCTLFLAFPASSFLLAKVFNSASQNLSQSGLIRLFVESQNTDGEVDEFAATLKRYQQVQSTEIISYEADPALPHSLPTTVIEVTPAANLSLETLEALTHQLQLIAMVDYVEINDRHYLRNQNVSGVTQKLSWAVYLLATLLLLLSIKILIKKDLESARLLLRVKTTLGATRWQILRPYLIRGALLGFFSLLVAMVMMRILSIIVHKISDDLTTLEWAILPDIAQTAVLLVLVLGAALWQTRQSIRRLISM